MKKVIIRNILFFTILFVMSNQTVLAKKDDLQHTNQFGVTVTEKEYEFINDFYGNDYFNDMTLDEYYWIKDLNIDKSNVEIVKSYEFDNIPYGSSITQDGKNLSIAKSCSSKCIIITLCRWASIPSIKSYDVIGARLSGVNLTSDIITTKVTSSNGTEYSNNLKKLSNGFGASIKLPSSGNGISIEQKYTVSTGGTVYVSYQHATTNISLETSKLYTISNSGYGRVFSFYGAAADVFDKMEGVSITV